MFLLGYDIGSSSIKAALVDASNNSTVAVSNYPETEMEILAPQTGWAEQRPNMWWDNICKATEKLLSGCNIPAEEIKAIGIAYQMHGLVLVDKQHKVLRDSIIWCDSRAVGLGDQALDEIGAEYCFKHLLNSPGNFTASKLKWVRDNEPDVFNRIHKFMLPGDFIAMKMSGEINTTISGLSEGIMWDFVNGDTAQKLFEFYDIDQGLIPEVVGAFEPQGYLTDLAGKELGLKPGIPVTYRAGDQPNNAMSLGVLESGEVAATGGTSGVVYGVVDQNVSDPLSRVNTFAHVNHNTDNPHLGVLLCINGAGIEYGWIKNQLTSSGTTYEQMEQMIQGSPVGSDGLIVIPFGNGAERIFGNKTIGSHIMNLEFNRHKNRHLYRAALEGIAFSFAYGINILKELGLSINVLKVGNDNLFQSQVFAQTVAALVEADIEVINTTGAIGAAKAAGVAVDAYGSLQEATTGLKSEKVYQVPTNLSEYQNAYGRWQLELNKLLKNTGH